MQFFRKGFCSRWIHCQRSGYIAIIFLLDPFTKCRFTRHSYTCTHSLIMSFDITELIQDLLAHEIYQIMVLQGVPLYGVEHLTQTQGSILLERVISSDNVDSPNMIKTLLDTFPGMSLPIITHKSVHFWQGLNEQIVTNIQAYLAHPIHNSRKQIKIEK